MRAADGRESRRDVLGDVFLWHECTPDSAVFQRLLRGRSYGSYLDSFWEWSLEALQRMPNAVDAREDHPIVGFQCSKSPIQESGIVQALCSNHRQAYGLGSQRFEFRAKALSLIRGPSHHDTLSDKRARHAPERLWRPDQAPLVPGLRQAREHFVPLHSSV